MKLRALLDLQALGNEYFEYTGQLQPVGRFHPPSLKNPQQVKTPMAQDGWHKGASHKARQKALKDLAEIHKRLRRQIGKPELSRTADYPVFPNLQQWQ
jgi:hypothetical protein